MAEWLGNGLQNRLQQFDSAWYLSQIPPEGRDLLLYALSIIFGDIYAPLL